ncbi:MAG: septation protein IspZ [Zoogloeaceae bacterium]|jgi:intracellular septation protein|nr:septation protein IspZ [Zoogloeaceae bacterium]
MKLLLPAILFLVSFETANRHQEAASAWIAPLFGVIAPKDAPILVATLILMAATVIVMSVVFLRQRRLEKMDWIALLLVLVFGGMTLALHDAIFIKWKLTIFYWTMAAGLAIAACLRKNALRLLLEEQMQDLRLPDHIWARLAQVWGVFFVLMGVLNLYVAYTCSNVVWVRFKVYGCTAILFLFVLIQAFFLARYLREEKN